MRDRRIRTRWVGVAFCLLLAAGSAPGVGAGRTSEVPRTPGAIPLGASPAAPDRWGALAHPTVTNLSVLATTSLLNGTTWAGDRVLSAGTRPVAAAYDSPDERLFVLVDGPPPGVLVLRLPGPQIVGFWPLPDDPLLAAAPGAILYDAAAARVFVANGPYDNLSVFDATNGTPVGAVGLAVGADPTGLALAPSAGAVYVSEDGLGQVVPVNDSTLAVGSPVSVGAHPGASVYDPLLGDVLVALGGADQIAVLAPGGSSVASRSAVGQDPDGIAFDPSNARVLVANGGSANVTVLNATSLTSMGEFGCGGSPAGLAISTRGIAYVPNAGSGNVTVWDDANTTSLGSLSAGDDPVSVAWDPSDGVLFVSNEGSDDLSELADAGPAAFATLPLGATTEGVSPLPGGNGFGVAIADAGAVDVVESITGGLSGSLDTGGAPEALVVDPAAGALDAAVQAPRPTGAGNVSVLNLTDGGQVARYSVGAAPDGIAYDPASGDLFVADALSYGVTVLDASNGTVRATVQMPMNGSSEPPADQVVVDPARDLVYVSEAINASLLVIRGSNDSVVGQIPTHGRSGPLAYDPSDDSVFVATQVPVGIDRIDAGTGRDVANFSLPVAPGGLAYDAATGALFVTLPGLASVEEIDPSTGAPLGTWSVGTAPTGIAYDVASAELLVADPAQASTALLGPPPPLFPVRFVETGWSVTPPGWVVKVDGVPYVSPTPTLWANQTNGSHAFVIPPEASLVADPASGVFTTEGNATTVYVVFAASLYDVPFQESGLPLGSHWWVNLSSGANLSSTNGSLRFAVPNGTYTYAIGTTARYAPVDDSADGVVTVRGFALPPERVSFAPLPPYTLRFHESGLPGGSPWSVFLAGGGSSVSVRPNLTIPVGNGTFLFSLPSVANRTPTPANGQLIVAGASPPIVEVVFGAGGSARYSVTFVASGLPAGQKFQVNVTGGGVATGTSVEFNLSNGSYAFTVGLAGAFAPDPDRGVLIVRGQNEREPIAFALPGGPGGTTEYLGLSPLALAEGAGVAGAAIVLLVIAFRVRRWAPSRPGRRPEVELVRSGPAPPGSTGGRADESDVLEASVVAGGEGGSAEGAEGPRAS